MGNKTSSEVKLQLKYIVVHKRDILIKLELFAPKTLEILIINT
jgi:hypothetical protein